MLLSAAAVAAQGPPGVTPPPAAPADTRWAPPPPLPSAGQPYRPLVPADSPQGKRPAVPTRPVSTQQKPGDDSKADPKGVPSDPKLPPPDNRPADPKADRDPPKGLETPTGQIDKARVFRFVTEADLLRGITRELVDEQTARDKMNPPDKKDEARVAVDPSYFAPPKVDALVAPGTVYQAKTLSYPPAQTVLEPGYVVHRRLHFEDLNSERYGWEVGFHQPAISTLLFWKDAVLFPAKLASNRGEWYDTNAGKCLPGSPVPYKVYPEPVDAFGLLVGTSTIIGGVAIFSGL